MTKERIKRAEINRLHKAKNIKKGELFRISGIGCGFDYGPKQPHDLENNTQTYHAFLKDNNKKGRDLIRITGQHEESLVTYIASAFSTSRHCRIPLSLYGTIKDLEPIVLELIFINFYGYIYGNKKDIEEYKKIYQI